MNAILSAPSALITQCLANKKYWHKTHAKILNPLMFCLFSVSGPCFSILAKKKKKAAAAIDSICQSKSQKLHFNYILIFICTNSVNAYKILRLLGQQLPGNRKKPCIIVQIRVASGGGWCLSVFIVLVSAFSNWTVTQLHWDKFGFLQTGCTKQNTSNKNLNKISFTFNH